MPLTYPLIGAATRAAVTETRGVHIGPICGAVTAAGPAGRCRRRWLLNS